MKFIYVFSEGAYQKLINLQYQLVNSDFEKSVFVFLNDGDGHQNLSSEDFKYVLSNTLTF